MSDTSNVDCPKREEMDTTDDNIAVELSAEVSSVSGSVTTTKSYSNISTERQLKFERAQKCLENAAIVSKRIKEHRKATAELLGRPFEDDVGGDTASEMASTMSERTGYSVSTDISTSMSVQEALNIPGISESLANTLKQKELLMERIKHYKEISKKPIKKLPTSTRKESIADMKNKPNDDVASLISTIKEKENTLTVIQVRMKAMETTILDLQEKINEKDQIIEAKNKATLLISDSLSKKERDSLALLEDTKQQMIKMQENFVAMESDWKNEKQSLIKEIQEKDVKIISLEEANSILEKNRFEMSLVNSELTEEINVSNQKINMLKEKIEELTRAQDLSSANQNIEQEKGSLEIENMVDLTKKIELLEQINCQIRQTNKELENKLSGETKTVATSSPLKKGSPLPSRKGGRNTASKIKSPWSKAEISQETDGKSGSSETRKLEMIIQSLNKDILEKEYLISQKDILISELTKSNTEQDMCIDELKERNSNELHVKREMIDIGVCTEKEETDIDSVQKTGFDVDNDGIVKELQQKLMEANDQISSLNSEVDAANKNMIKVKSSHKLKIKQLQKTIDNFGKVSEANTEIVKLNEELHQLSQKVAELEEEKGNLQLHLVDYDSGRLTESDVYKKMIETENLAETRLKSISVLESQKFELVQELHDLQQKYVEMEDKLADAIHVQNEQVTSEIKSVQLEEQIDELIATKRESDLVVENLKLDREQLNRCIRLLQDEKDELNNKLQHYIQVNMELTDKLEKLSAEKVSSAESIEIVESLTIQEKLELQEYNKNMSENKIEDDNDESKVKHSRVGDENIQKLVEESAELNRKIELFTQERQEVMEKMARNNAENESLQEKIIDLVNQVTHLQNNIDTLNKEKHEIVILNEDLNRQIEELKRERFEVIKEAAEVLKPIVTEETPESCLADNQNEEKLGDKTSKGTKSVKQLTKEILKLKNIIKEREDEIADCQVKILALEEYQQKQNDLMQSNSVIENKLTLLLEENNHLKEALNIVKKDKDNCDKDLSNANDLLQKEMQNIQQEYSNALHKRDSRIQELENVLLGYEKQMINYNNNLQQKDKEIVEYINNITKLNDVSQKLKSTIDLLEEEKAKDQNTELIKSLNKQISVYQKKLSDCDEKLRSLDEEKSQLYIVQSTLENKNVSLENELKILQEAFNEKQSIYNELQLQQQKHVEEMSAILDQTKERDEEIHEIKLQLRKESIENEKLRSSLVHRDNTIEEQTLELNQTKEHIVQLSSEKDVLNQQCTSMENKNKELLEKLKKFAINIKKKSAMYIELENRLHEVENELNTKNNYLDQHTVQLDELSELRIKLQQADSEIKQLLSQKIQLEQEKSVDIDNITKDCIHWKEQFENTCKDITRLNESLQISHDQTTKIMEENMELKSQIDILYKKIAEHEVDQKNNLNLNTKISGLEVDISKKDSYIFELLNKIKILEEQFNQLQFGHAAKIQERDVFIESLEIEISKFKTRISRLEESISIMEDRRHSLERKADQLDNQLLEKHKAYTEFRSQEDELVNRLAVLMDHDQVLEKQLREIENENKEMLYKLQCTNEENTQLRKSIADIQEHYNTIKEKANKTDIMETTVIKYQEDMRETERNLKQLSSEHQAMLLKKKEEFEELEAEFNTQIEKAIKEKKLLSEKYEKMTEYVSQLENKLQEFSSNIENLKINHEELGKINQNLVDKIKTQAKVQEPDYKEQYILEINNLNSVINSQNSGINDLNNKIKHIKADHDNVTTNLEKKILETNAELQNSIAEVENLMTRIKALEECNNKLNQELIQKDDQIRHIMENKKLTIEMNIPKTEGMVISSTIEPLSGECDMSSIESQIVSGNTSPQPDKIVPKKVTESKQMSSSNATEEPIIVAKKAYLCYDQDENLSQNDPFNSEDGWGFGASEDVVDITPGLSHLNNRIIELQKINDSLKADLNTSNTKLLKALKKLKELKTNNDLLSNELKIMKQISQTSFLDNAIEDELNKTIKDLETKVQELSNDLSKEKRDNDALKKQNEIFNNANERLTEIKEKMDSEIEMWKFKFREAKDKMSSVHLSEVPKVKAKDETVFDESIHSKTYFQDQITKLDRENEELSSVNDFLSSENKTMSMEIKLLKENNSKHEIDLHDYQNKFDTVNECVEKLQKENSGLIKENNSIKEELHILKTAIDDYKQKYDIVMNDNSVLQSQVQYLTDESQRKCKEYENDVSIKNDELKMYLTSRNELVDECNTLKRELENMKKLDAENNSRISVLESELESFKIKAMLNEKDVSEQSDSFQLSEKYILIQDQYEKVTQELQEANSKIMNITAENQDLIQNNNKYIEQIQEINDRLQKLNTENDQLLSTVAELRSSVSSAVDQRGFEIAELWKQHLAQRETDFQRIEQELRSQLKSYEQKYEDLLDSVQSSSQEETSKLVVIEQLTSLQSKLQDKEEHLQNLQDKYAEVVNQLDILRSEMEDEKVMHENRFLTQQDEYEKHIQVLSVNFKSNSDNYEQQLQSISTALNSSEVKCEEMTQLILELQNTVKEKEKNIVDMTNELRDKDSEIRQKVNDYLIMLNQRNEEFETVSKQLIICEKKIEDLSYEKESELAIMRLKIHENSKHYENRKKEINEENEHLTEALNAKVIECTNLNKQIADLNKSLEEHKKESSEMQLALETQELEIVTLKDEIVALQEEVRASSTKIAKHVTFASGTKSSGDDANTTGQHTTLLDPVPRAELDLALYMLHQRDVRCEELTMELTQLLEERDTLQLRLSDSLRSYEDLKIKCGSLGVESLVTASDDKLSALPAAVDKDKQFVDIHKTQTSRSSSISETEGDRPKLQAKLSELRTVKHSRDVTLRHESEQRDHDLRLLQRDVANLPPEAAAQLAQAHHTLSRDAQSTSTVLLNWLRGKSTPKVVQDM